MSYYKLCKCGKYIKSKNTCLQCIINKTEGKNKMEKNENKQVNKPIHTLRAKGLSLSAWENKGEKNGNNYCYNTFTFKRSYKDGDDWKETTLLRELDLPVLRTLLDEMFKKVLVREDKKE